jgi:hypothetical protein
LPMRAPCVALEISHPRQQRGKDGGYYRQHQKGR